MLKVVENVNHAVAENAKVSLERTDEKQVVAVNPVSAVKNRS
jgi:hypothetical protein